MLVSWALIYAQELPSASTNWGDVLKTYGYAAPFLLFLLYVVRELRNDIKSKDAKIELLTNKITDNVIPLVTESSNALKESTEIIRDSANSTKELQRVLDDISRKLDH